MKGTIMADIRDTKFLGFAESHYLELSDLFAEMYACQITNDHSGEDQARHNIHDLLAQRAFDLVYHTLSHTTQAMAAECEHRPAIKECTDSIPDLDAWPEIYQIDWS
jgi:hypothetical protein